MRKTRFLSFAFCLAFAITDLDPVFAFPIAPQAFSTAGSPSATSTPDIDLVRLAGVAAADTAGLQGIVAQVSAVDMPIAAERAWRTAGTVFEAVACTADMVCTAQRSAVSHWRPLLWRRLVWNGAALLARPVVALWRRHLLADKPHRLRVDLRIKRRVRP
jgi:hypothetical protein